MNSEMVVYLLFAGSIGILFKIVWDWLAGLKGQNGIKAVCKQRMDKHDEEILKLYERIEKLGEKLETTIEKINKKIDEKFELIIKMLTQERS
jgi:hypothetical protein